MHSFERVSAAPASAVLHLLVAIWTSQEFVYMPFDRRRARIALLDDAII